jgi:hypothetical protein
MARRHPWRRDNISSKGDSMIKDLIDTLANLNPQKIIGIVILLILILILFPFIDSNIVQPKRLSQEIQNLDSLTKIDQNKINDNPVFKMYYEKIISRMNNSIEIKTKDNSIPIWQKFISGGSLSWLLIFVALFAKYEKAIQKIGGIFLLLLIGSIMGFIGILIPSFEIAQINIIVYPLMQLLLLISIVLIAAKKNK